MEGKNVARKKREGVVASRHCDDLFVPPISSSIHEMYIDIKTQAYILMNYHTQWYISQLEVLVYYQNEFVSFEV